MIKIIESINNPLISSLLKLDYKTSHTFLVEGEHLVKEAKLNKRLLQVFSVDESLLKDYSEYECYQISDKIAKKLSKTINSQNIFGLVSIAETNEIDYSKYQKVLLLDDIQDPGNLGTLIRSAAAFGYKGIFAGSNTVSFYNDKVVRASQGAIFKVDLYKGDLSNYIKALKKEQFTIYGTSVEKGIPLEQVEEKNKFAVVLGNEANGIKKEILSLCDNNIYIVMEDNVESLNVSVAGSIIMWKM